MKTVSLELAKQHKEAKIGIETEFYWVNQDIVGWELTHYKAIRAEQCELNFSEHYYIPAPTTDELLEWLAKRCEVGLRNIPTADEMIWLADGVVNRIEDLRESSRSADTPADALAKLVLWVKGQEK